jgi:hypothetical protein
MNVPNGFPGNALRSFTQRLKGFQFIPDQLDSLHQRYGNIFWHFSSLLAAPVLVIYDLDVIRGILDEESWIFNKALEPWHDRHQSNDAFERLVGDGLMLADGNHHRKHAALLGRTLASNDLWGEFQVRLYQRLDDCLRSDIDNNIDDLCHFLARDFVSVYYCLDLDDALCHHIVKYLSIVWSAKQRQIGCPFRNYKRKSSRRLISEIDLIKSQLRSLLDHRPTSQTDNSLSSSVQISNQAVVDEILMIMMSFVCKLPSLMQASLQSLDNIHQSQRHNLSLEWSLELSNPSTETLLKICPHTSSQLHHTMDLVERPELLLKRVTVCDAIIYGRVVSETTELWIPTWPPNLQLLFGLGCYGCKGEQLSLLIAARFMQWFCCDS